MLLFKLSILSNCSNEFFSNVKVSDWRNLAKSADDLMEFYAMSISGFLGGGTTTRLSDLIGWGTSDEELLEPELLSEDELELLANLFPFSNWGVFAANLGDS